MTEPRLSYLICSTRRSGSTLLCEAMTNMGIASRPEEYYQQRKKTGLPRRPREYFEDAETAEIVAILGGSADTVRDAVFAEGTYHCAYEPQRSIRTREWKYVRRFDGRTRPVLPNVDDSAGKELWIEHGWPTWLLDPEQLYDLVLDPNETRNVIHEPANEFIAHELPARLEECMRETGDPLVDGPVPPPPGAEINDPDQRSADDPVTIVGG